MNGKTRWLGFGLMVTACLTMTEMAWAHPGHAAAGDDAFTSGLLHPLLGVDHLLAMLASGMLALGMSVGRLRRRSLWVGAGLVGLFAISHGYAHIAAAGSLALLPYMLGFAATTISLHMVAIAVGLTAERSDRTQWARIAGAGVAACCAVILSLG